MLERHRLHFSLRGGLGWPVGRCIEGKSAAAMLVPLPVPPTRGQMPS
jgi:hypothetical protein